MCTIEEALADEWIRVHKRDDALGIYEVKLGELNTVIKIKLFQISENGPTHFELSHFIKTPQNAYRYSPSVTSDACPGEALRRAIDSLTAFYEVAIEEGDKPAETWLVPNK
jgi:hypothetical protein